MHDFQSRFLASYLAGGLGTMGKRDVDVLVMHLLDEFGLEAGEPLKRLSNQELSLKLRAPVARVRTLRYEARLKHGSHNDAHARWTLLEVLARARFELDKDRVSLQIEDSFTRHWLQARLKADGVVFDNAFNTELVKVNVEELCRLLAALYDPASVATLQGRLKAAQAEGQAVSVAEIKKEFLNAAAGKLGETVSDLALKGLLGLVGLG